MGQLPETDPRVEEIVDKAQSQNVEITSQEKLPCLVVEAP